MRKKKKYVKYITALLCAVVLSGSLGSCGKPEGGESAPQPESGRYTETEVALPGELADYSVRQIFAVEDEVHLLATKQEDGHTHFQEWSYKEEGFEDVTGDWLASFTLDCGDWLETMLLQDKDGVQYLYAGYVAAGEDAYKSHLWRAEGGEVKEITPEKWTIPDEDWGSYERVLTMAALENGSLFSVSYSSLDLLSGEDGSVLTSEDASDYMDANVFTDGKNLYLSSPDDSGVSIEKRPEGSAEDASSSVLPQNGSGSLHFCAQPDGTLFAASSEGVFRCPADGSDWEKLMEPNDTDFVLTDRWCTDMAALSNGQFFALFEQSGNGCLLKKYEYDPNAVTEVTTRLTLYTVYESYLLQNAAALYHRAHPEVAIDIQYVYSAYSYEELDKDAVYQELNTLLTGENAPDILVLDHLNQNTYIEKGLLADLGDVVDEMEANGELLSTITGSYVNEDGSRYVVPLQFGFSMALGRDIDPKDMETLKALAAFLSREEISYLGEKTTEELVDLFYPYFCDQIIDGKTLNREALGENLEYLKAIADNCGIVPLQSESAASQEMRRTSNMWNLPSACKLAFQTVKGFNNCMAPLSMVEYIQGDFTAFERCFIPSLQMGVCTKSQYQDTAKDFLRFALSQTIQDVDHYSGFPVNLSSLQIQAAANRSQASAETMIEVDGGYEPFTIGDYPKELSDRLIALCQTLDTPIREDDMIRSVLIETLEGYLTGSQSKEDTIQKIEDGLKMYLAE
ncbi:MAG: extracellular solute-binding protein [Candidatus Gastranaerophilales bacterium]|nr:extracellular solute-binding protein [Candidatus Gastranaerophilales bacterium]